jgi:hypothetical protein
VIGKALLAVALGLGLSACNPLISDPVSVGGELEQTAARYTGPAAAWLEVAVSGAPDHAVFAFALIENTDLHGPAQRSCSGGAAVVPCVVTASDVRMPNQQRVAGDGSQRVRLMTVWSGETVQLVLVCVDPDTQELGCPAAVRTVLSAVNAGGHRVGDLVPGTPSS